MDYGAFVRLLTASREFVADMEYVSETCEKPYDPACPVVCTGEQPVRLVGETRVPIPATEGHPGFKLERLHPEV